MCWRFPRLCRSSLAPFWREQATRITRVGVPKGRKLPSCRGPIRTFLSRSAGSRDERALRAPLKATPDSKLRPSPAATLAPGPPSSPPSRHFSLILPLVSFLLSVSLSHTHSLSLCPLYPLLSLLEFYFIPVRLCPSFTLSSAPLIHYYLTLSFTSELPPEDAIILDVHSISGNFNCLSMGARIGRAPIFTAEELSSLNVARLRSQPVAVAHRRSRELRGFST